MMYCTEISVERAASSSKRRIIFDDRGMAGYPIEEPSLGCARFRIRFILYLALLFRQITPYAIRLYSLYILLSFQLHSCKEIAFHNSKRFSTGSTAVLVEIPCPATRILYLAGSNPALSLQVQVRPRMEAEGQRTLPMDLSFTVILFPNDFEKDFYRIGVCFIDDFGVYLQSQNSDYTSMLTLKCV